MANALQSGVSFVALDSVGHRFDKALIEADHLLDDHEEQFLLLAAGEEFAAGALGRFQLREGHPGLHAYGECHLRWSHESSSVHQFRKMAHFLADDVGSELGSWQVLLSFFCQDIGAT